MESKNLMKVTDVRRKVSGQGNMYYTLDLEESLSQLDENNEPIKRDWVNMYFVPKNHDTNVVNFKARTMLVTLNFYPTSRKVGENTYHEIKANILDVEEA